MEAKSETEAGKRTDGADGLKRAREDGDQGFDLDLDLDLETKESNSNSIANSKNKRPKIERGGIDGSNHYLDDKEAQEEEGALDSDETRLKAGNGDEEGDDNGKPIKTESNDNENENENESLEEHLDRTPIPLHSQSPESDAPYQSPPRAPRHETRYEEAQEDNMDDSLMSSSSQKHGTSSATSKSNSPSSMLKGDQSGSKINNNRDESEEKMSYSGKSSSILDMDLDEEEGAISMADKQNVKEDTSFLSSSQGMGGIDSRGYGDHFRYWSYIVLIHHQMHMQFTESEHI
jgi:hypothetical protein